MAAPRILVVEDERVLAEGLRYLLETQMPGAKVDVATSAHEALETLRAEAARGRPFDLVITDERMPRMSGVQLLAQLHEIAPGASGMMFTAYPETVERAMKEGRAVAVVIKPDFSTLLGTTRALLTARAGKGSAA